MEKPLKVYINDYAQPCCECGEEIPLNAKIVWRHKHVRVQGEQILDISKCCIPCAKKNGWLAD